MIRNTRSWLSYRAHRKAVALLAGALGTLALAGCETWNVSEYNVRLARKYPTPENATPVCIDAAARARKWCRDETLSTDTLWQGNCNTAQWDYNNNCR